MNHELERITSNDVNQNYRHNDPPTSALAGCEIENRLGIKAHKRLAELRRAGMVRNGKPRTCTVSGKLAMTWQPNVGNHCAGELA